MDQEKLARLLQASQVPDTEQVKAVTADLQKNYYTKPESLLLLIEIALTHGDAAVRQQGSVQALRLVAKHWGSQPADKKPLVRSHLLEGTLKETLAANRHSLSRLIAGIVAADMEESEGEDFLKQLLPLNTSDNVVFREVGSFILYAMLDDDPAHFSDHTHQLLQLFQSRLDDESKEVRMNIVRAIGAILMIIDPEEDPQSLSAMQSFVPSLVNILKATVEASDEESYSIVFDVFHSFIAFDSSLLSLHLRDLLMFMIELGANTRAEEDPRSQALGFLIQAVRYRRMKIQGMKDVGAELMIKAMHIAIDLDSDDDEDTSPARVAISLIDQLASELPPRQVIVPLLDQFPAFATNPDPRYRMAAMLALGNAAEGAPDFISTQLSPLLPTILNLLRDSETRVRHAALVGLIHLAEEMADEMASHQSQIIEAVLMNLETASQTASEKNVNIIRCCCGALDTFGDGIDTKIMAQYGPSLIGPMLKLLNHEDFGVKAAAASAVGAIASSMDKDFQPYFEGAMKALGNFVMLKDSEEAMNLRSSACDSLGRIAMAVGAEAFQPYVMDLMKASEEALGLDNPRLKETTFLLWSNLSKVYHEQFDPFLGGVFQGIFSSLEIEEEELDIPGLDPSLITDGAIVVGGKRVKVKAPELDEDEDADIASGDEDWDDIEDLQDELTGVTAMAMEQEIALDVLGDVISNSCNSNNLEQFVEKTIEKVVPFTDHDYEGCRKSAIATLWRTYTRVFQVWEQSAGVKWSAGLPPQHVPPASIINIGSTLYEATMTIYANDSDRSVVTDVNRNVAATLKACGPAVLGSKDGMLQELVSVISLLLTRSHPCQMDLGDEDEEQDADAGSSEYDWLAIDTALDVVVALAAVLGPDFGELWKIFEKPVLKLAASSEDLQRSTAIGTIAEITKYSGESITPYTVTVGQALIKRLSDPDALTKSNAAYAVGLLVLNSTDIAKTIPMYPALWEKLEPLLSVRDMHVTDNVAGALSRMIIKNSNAEFVAQALPAIVRTLPLEDEYEENEPIYRAIYTLYEQSNETVQQLTPQLVGIFEKVLGPPEGQLEPATRQLLCQLVQMLYKNRPELLANNPGLLPLAEVSH